MAALDHERLVGVFLEACDLPADARGAFLDAACADSAEMRARVEALLAEDRETAFLERPALGTGVRRELAEVAVAHADDAPAAKPLRVGRYTVLRTLGAGGMGTVYLARQERPERLVALKLVRRGLASAPLARRFEREAEVLGRLQHPGIAQIFEAGHADLGDGEQPYFAMEYVRGRTLLDHAEAEELSAERRVALLAHVADAVQHAHEHGVVHRDLKPENVLVGPDGRPKILDFGVARATDADVQLTTVRSDVGTLIGTLPYMSPEQTRGDARRVDARSDVYALGVVAFELLAGRPPFDLRGKDIVAGARVIQDEDPPRLGTIDARLAGDLETIVTTAMAKEPERRYASAAEFAADLRRFQGHEPIAARPPSTLYQLRKFARRNRFLLTSVAVAALSLVTATVVSLRYAVRAAHERGEARRLAYTASVAGADLARRAGNLGLAKEQLARAPAERRGWEWRWLAGSIDASARTLTGHAYHVWQVAAAPDGARLYSCAGDATLRVWETATGEEIAVLRDHRARVFSVAASPDGTRFASGSAEKAVRIWDAKTLETVAVLEGHEDACFGLAFSPDGSRLVTGANDGTLMMWDVATAKPLRDLAGHPEWVWQVAFAPDGATIASASTDDTVRLWDAEDGTLIEELRGHEGDVVAVAFSPDSTLLASGAFDGAVRVWDRATGACVATLEGHADWVGGVAFAPDGATLASASHDRTIRVWDARTWEPVTTLRGHEQCARSVAFLPDGGLVSGGWDDAVKIWDAARVGELVAPRVREVVEDFAFDPLGPRLTVLEDGGRLAVEVARTGMVEHQWALRGDERRVVVAPSGDLLALGSPGATHLWTLDGTLLGKFGGWPLAIGPESEKMVVRGANGPEIRAVQDGRLLFALDLPKARAVSFHPNGRRLALGVDRSMTVVDVRTGETVHEMTQVVGEVTDLAFGPDGLHLACTRSDRSLELLTGDTFAPVARLEHTASVTCLAWSPDAARLVTGSSDGAVTVFALDPPATMVSFDVEATVERLAFGPEGDLLAVLAGGRLSLFDGAPR